MAALSAALRPRRSEDYASGFSLAERLALRRLAVPQDKVPAQVTF